jgi:uncharacterized protein YPO0396
MSEQQPPYAPSWDSSSPDTSRKSPDVSGFRLQRLEILNWGTFNGPVYRVNANGATSLLTGANGSGKSTVVDALLTLLVPNQRRNYNLASGGEQKKERNERSYVLGAYGRTRDEGSPGSHINYLRTRDNYSMLLVIFEEGATGKCVSLAQVFYFQGDNLNKFQVLAQREMSITEDLSGFENIRGLRRRLKADDAIQIFDNFSEYEAAFRRALGIDSPKALDLFNQTVSIKEIGNLNDFIRRHMLERPDVQERIADLRRNFDNLDKAHRAIVRAREQQAILAPLMKRLDKFDSLTAEISELLEIQKLLPAHFAKLKLELIHTELKTRAEKQTQAENRLADSDKILRDKRDEEFAIRQALEHSEEARRIAELERELREIETRLSHTSKARQRYNRLAEQVSLPQDPTENAFYRSRENAQRRLGENRNNMEEVDTQRDALTLDLGKNKELMTTLESELASLLERSTMIPAALNAIRSRAAGELGLSEETLSFAGERLRVRASAKEQTGLIERLLRPLSLTLLIPAEHGRSFGQWLNKQDLGDCLRYRVSTQVPADVTEIKENSLEHVLEIQESYAEYDWLRAVLTDEYGLRHVKSVESLEKEENTYTEKGLVHREWQHYDKDDRYPEHDSRHWYLGWDNREKIKLLQQEYRTLETRQQELERNRELISTRRRQLEQENEYLRDLLLFSDFNDIDGKPLTARKEQALTALRELEDSSDRLTALRAQLSQVQTAITECSAQRDTWIARLSRYTREKQELDEDAEHCRAILSTPQTEHTVSSERHALLTERISASYSHSEPNIRGCDRLENKTTSHFVQKHRTLNTTREQLEKGLLLSMERFKTAYAEDMVDIDVNIDAAGDFRTLYQAIIKDDLPRYEKRFKELLDEKVVMDVTSFSNYLNKECEQIQEKIRDLNGSLQQIDYSPETYIVLNCEKTSDQAVNEFRHMLLNCFENLGTRAGSERNELGFKRIKELVNRFDTEEYWTARVTDVRNWLEFSASERYRNSDNEKNYYSDSSGKSGGQKAKLAYTILASAISFQYGIGRGQMIDRSFRFVVVDEAFSKSDDTNSRYAMELFRRLGLQLLVVSPLDKTHIVEPYIGACHFVLNNAEENNSRLFNLSMKEYQTRKAEFIENS